MNPLSSARAAIARMDAAALVAKWRGHAAQLAVDPDHTDACVGQTFQCCADELEAAIRALGPEAGEGAVADVVQYRHRMRSSGEWSEWITEGPLHHIARQKAINRPDLYEVRELYPAPPAARRGCGDAWLPIESAPRDGTSLLLWGVLGAGPARAMAGTWLDYDLLGWVAEGEMVNPTHWQPLPAPPALQPAATPGSNDHAD
jgi:hypothetical protein